MSKIENSEDDFWNLSPFLPKRDADDRAVRSKSDAVARDTSAVDIEIPVDVKTDVNITGDGGAKPSISRLALRFREVEVKGTAARQNTEPKKSAYKDEALREARPKQVSIPKLNPKPLPTTEGKAKSERESVSPGFFYGRRGETEAPEYEYELTNCLITKASVFKIRSTHDFYSGFRSDAKRYFGVVGKKAEFAPYFSYTPQYRQMSTAQLAYYFWWRENVRASIYPDTDYTYILLYIFEIINLPDLIPPSKGLDALCSIWLAYREKYNAIDKNLEIWVMDYCLLYKLPCPTDKLKPILGEIVSKKNMRYFYVTYKDGKIDAKALIEIFSDYMWKDSVFDKEPESGEKSRRDPDFYSRLIIGALEYVINEKQLLRIEKSDFKPSWALHYLYCGALVSDSVNRHIRLEYLKFNRESELRTPITAAVKYSENKVRAYLGIRSRLQAKGLPPKIAEAIDEYFEIKLPMPQAVKKKPQDDEEEEYAAEYEPESDVLDITSARDIENKSWEITEKLTESMAAESEPEATSADAEKAEHETVTYVEICASDDEKGDASETLRGALDDTLLRFLDTALSGDGAAQSELCRKSGIYADSAAAKINETAVDIIGDIVLTPSEDGKYYVIIEDYREEASV
ncbi:MAG: TerB N-terminal domain-containing protein [Clostridiales bacterium]|nr:TerB N-terminal domain-containing protein [Clostridiales bacterium]